jgi:hypothetical protein
MARKKAGATTTKKVEADEPIAQTAITKRGRTLVFISHDSRDAGNAGHTLLLPDTIFR